MQISLCTLNNDNEVIHYVQLIVHYNELMRATGTKNYPGPK